MGAGEKPRLTCYWPLPEKLKLKALTQRLKPLLELIYKLQQEENDPTMKVLIFTEFVPTQTMLAGFLESRGFSVALAKRQHGPRYAI
jgi:hypothetical protein